jgi:hypothetical protein
MVSTLMVRQKKLLQPELHQIAPPTHPSRRGVEPRSDEFSPTGKGGAIAAETIASEPSGRTIGQRPSVQCTGLPCTVYQS